MRRPGAPFLPSRWRRSTLVRLGVAPPSLVCRARRERKPREKKKAARTPEERSTHAPPGVPSNHFFFLSIFFRVTHDGLSGRGTTKRKNRLRVVYCVYGRLFPNVAGSTRQLKSRNDKTGFCDLVINFIESHYLFDGLCTKYCWE